MSPRAIASCDDHRRTSNRARRLDSEALPKVDVEALRRHRLENTNPARRGSWAGRLLGEGEPPPAAGPVGEAPPAATGSEAPPNYAYAKAVRETVLAKRARIDLDEKCKLLVPIAEVQDAIFDAGTVLQRDLLELGPQLAERLANMTDVREIAALLETELRCILATLAASLRAKAAAEEANHATAEVTPHHDPQPSS